MPDNLAPPRCDPTENVHPLVAVFRELAAARRRARTIVTGAAEGAAGGIQPPPITLAQCDWTEAQRYAHYQQMLEARGYTVDATHPTVVALRGLSANGTVHETTSAARFDDTIVVLTRDAGGNPHVTTFPGSTHAGQSKISDAGAKKSGVKDVDGTGGPDVGMVNAGEYQLIPRGTYNGGMAWDVRNVDGSGVLAGVRDTNHDGKFTDAERAASQARGDTLDGVMIHRGDTSTPQSVGCINLSRNEDVYPKFVGTIGDGKEPAKLVILDANAR